MLLRQTEASEKGREFQLCSGRSGRQARRLLFGLRRPDRVPVLFEPALSLIFLLSFVVLYDLVPEPAVDPQGPLETEAAPHTGDPAAERAAHGEEAAPGLRERLQAGLAESVAAVEHAGDALQTGVRQEAHAALVVLAQDHGAPGLIVQETPKGVQKVTTGTNKVQYEVGVVVQKSSSWHKMMLRMTVVQVLSPRWLLFADRFSGLLLH